MQEEGEEGKGERGEGEKKIKAKKMKKEKKLEIDLTKEFPRKLLLFSTELFKKRKIPFLISSNFLSKKEGKLVWISTEQHSRKISEIFSEYGFDISKEKERVILVDFVSKSSGIKTKSEEEIYFVENPNNLVEISMLFTDIFSNEEVKLAVLDSINGLLAFNKKESVIQLLRFLSAIAYDTNTTILVTYDRGEYGKEVESAIRVCTDASIVVEDESVILRTRSFEKSLNL